MNSIINNVVRSVFSHTIKRISHGSFLPYSTAVCNTIESPKCEEPDKLYKNIEIEMRAHTPASLKSYAEFLKMAADHLNIPVGKCWAPKKPFFDRNPNLTVLRSRSVHKKHRTQYEVRTYFRFANFHHLTGSTADTFLEYVERNVPEGVALKITKVALEKLPPEITQPPSTIEDSSHEEAQQISS